MVRSSTFARTCILAFFTLAAFDAHAQSQRFDNPSVRGVRLDWCRNWGANCGQAAADLFCREMRFDRAARFAQAPGLGRTLVFGDGRLCQGPQCDGFASITCERTATAAPQQAPSTERPGVLFRAPPIQAAPPTMMVPAPARPPAAELPLPTTPIQPAPPPATAEQPPVLLPLPQTPVQPPAPAPARPAQQIPVLPPPASVAVPIPRPRPQLEQPPQVAQPAQPIPPPAPEARPAPVTTVSVAPLPAPPPAPTKPPAIKFQPLSPKQISDLLLGKIWLITPAVEPPYLGEFPNPRAGQIPVWDDETVFKWKPSNPNMADSYELRFYNAPEAGTPVGSLKIDGSRTYARPGPKFLTQLLEDIGVRPGPQDDLLSLLAKAISAKTGSIFWEVAGYRGYNASGVASDAEAGSGPQPSSDQAGSEPPPAPEQINAQVAVSERWPLRIPDRPNGFSACGRQEGQPPEFNFYDIELQNPSAFAEQRVGIDYAGDEIQLAGQFSLATSPYAAHPKEIMAEPPPGSLINLKVASYRFDNLFVDWGDGEVEELTLDALDHLQYGRGSLLGLPPLKHTYTRPGSFIIRIFQVSEADVQKVDVASLNVAHKVSMQQQFTGGAKAGPAATGQSIGYYDALAAGQAADKGLDLSQAKAATDLPILQGGFPLEVANRAYVVYCKPVTLTEPKDEVANGPLVLYTADIAFDSTHAVDKNDPVEGRVSVCDQSAQARARLTYVGKGKVTVTWKIDGTMIGGVTEHDVGPSPPRSGIEMKQGVEPEKGTWLSDWIPLEVSEAMLGGRKVTVEIKVVENAPFKAFGLIRPSRHTQGGAPPVITMPVMMFPLTTGNGPPPVKDLTSAPHTLTVVDSDQTKPCHMRFLVSGGAFEVYLPDPDQVAKTADDTFSGTGNLVVSFADKKNAFSVPIAFEDWQLENGTDVVSGALSVDGIADAKVNLPGLEVTLSALTGKAGATDGTIEATINVRATGGALRDANGSAKPPSWTGERASLAPDGDWYRDAAKTGIERSLIGWSGFSVEANTVALDFSASQGNGPDNLCGSAGPDWTGARLDNAIVEPNLLNLSTLRVPVFGWVIGKVTGGNGLCGDIAIVNPVDHQPVGEGHISIKHLAATVRGGFVKSANYVMEVEVPLLGVTLSGTGTLMETAGKAAGWDLTGLTGPPADLDLGPLRLQAGNYQFGSDITGWRVTALAVLSLAAEGKPFATVTASGVRFGMNGRVHFDDNGATSSVLALGGNSTLGESPVNLQSATLTGPTSGDHRLDVKVATTMHLSDKLESPKIDVAYTVDKSGSNVTASGPATEPFELKVAFPPGDPAMSAKIRPHYVAPKAGQPSGIKFYADTNNAAVDMFGGTGPIQSAFVLGYAGSSDYWMTLTNYDLGPTGTPLMPPTINLFKVGGGLGYHVNTDKFVGLSDVKSIAADTGKGMTFIAGMTAGTPDHLTFTMDGQLKMTETNKVRFDFTSWLLKQASGSTGDFTGFIQYGGGSFDGQLWGALSMLDGAVKLSADKGAVDVHFGSGGPWHIYLGRREGPKIQTTLLSLGGTSGYLMLSGDGFFVGSGADVNLGGSVGPFSASVKGWLDTELGIEPLKPRVSGGGKGGLSVKGCAFGLCVGPTASVAVKMAALPVDVSAKACFKVDLLLKTVGACGNVHL